ncbi:MAG: hypothetical protein HY238_12215 [Acidobacteria bacterium]|nr:hypothetical protein [Acidobacteriota bacterium]
MPNALEERIAGLEGSYRELTKRIDDLRSEMHRGFDGVRAEMSEMKAELNESRTEWRTSFRWTMSLILINWLSLLGAIFLVAGRK